MKMQWRSTGNWTLVGVIRKEHEVYALFDPLATKAEASQILQHCTAHLLQMPDLWASV
jgi:hypothetical protein